MNLENIYSHNDLAKLELFKGNFINYGYWRDIALSDKITVEQRTQASRQLYQLVINLLEVEKEDKVVEVGCGYGIGISMIDESISDAQLFGVDLFIAQSNRAFQFNRHLQSKTNIMFINGSAEKLPFPDKSINKIFSLEAAQHFASMNKFINEVVRVIKENGKVILSTFMAKKNTVASKQRLKELLPSVELGFDRIIDFNKIVNKLKTYFNTVDHQAIGEFVFPQFDKWISQTSFKNEWAPNWFVAYSEGLIDYYWIKACKI